MEKVFTVSVVHLGGAHEDAHRMYQVSHLQRVPPLMAIARFVSRFEKRRNGWDNVVFVSEHEGAKLINYVKHTSKEGATA